jgi:hypothetical protein
MQNLRLPAGTRCRVATILVTDGRPSGASAIRWWSNDGGSSWSIFGRC